MKGSIMREQDNAKKFWKVCKEILGFQHLWGMSLDQKNEHWIIFRTGSLSANKYWKQYLKTYNENMTEEEKQILWDCQ